MRNADCIAVVSKGSVIETGSHEELLSKGGAYATLVQMQQSAGADEDHRHLHDGKPIFGRRSSSLDVERIDIVHKFEKVLQKTGEAPATVSFMFFFCPFPGF